MKIYLLQKKNVGIDLSVILKSNDVPDLKNLLLTFKDEYEIYEHYKDAPNLLLKNTSLVAFIQFILANDYEKVFFSTIAESIDRYFPELFVVENCRLILEDDENENVAEA